MQRAEAPSGTESSKNRGQWISTLRPNHLKSGMMNIYTGTLDQSICSSWHFHFFRALSSFKYIFQVREIVNELDDIVRLTGPTIDNVPPAFDRMKEDLKQNFEWQHR